MTLGQLLFFALFAAVLVALLSGRVRHDLVAAAGLLTAVALGLVPQDRAFSGFSNPAVLIVAFVLLASRALENSGALDIAARVIEKPGRSTPVHIAITGGIAAALSSVINNVAALAVLMPLDIRAAIKAGRPPGLTLMPMAFMAILGGMITLIGTPPNIVASSIRQEKLGQPYGFFDFTPAGLAVALAGLAFVVLGGWRLTPVREDPARSLTQASSFEADVAIAGESPSLGKRVGELDSAAKAADVEIVDLYRGRQPIGYGFWWEAMQEGDFLRLRGSGEAIGAFVKTAGLQLIEKQAAPDGAPGGTQSAPEEAAPEIIEAVVRGDSRLTGRSAAGFDLRARYGAVLLGISRAGVVARLNIRHMVILPGDVLLLTGRAARSERTLAELGLIGVNRVEVAPLDMRRASLTIAAFGLAIALASAGVLTFTIAIAMSVVAFAAFGLLRAREIYTAIDWPVIVMLACLLPLGEAFENLGGAALIAGQLAELTAGYGKAVALISVMVITMMLSDVLNNVATIIVTGPVAIDLARKLDSNPDAFLMGAAIAASCAFLTPIGHQNNTLIMGPGGFRFGDYWRMGLPLEIVVLLVSVPVLMMMWPL